MQPRNQNTIALHKDTSFHLTEGLLQKCKITNTQPIERLTVQLMTLVIIDSTSQSTEWRSRHVVYPRQWECHRFLPVTLLEQTRSPVLSSVHLTIPSIQITNIAVSMYNIYDDIPELLQMTQ